MTDQDVRALARKIHQLEQRIETLSRARQVSYSSIPVQMDPEAPAQDVPVPWAVGKGAEAAVAIPGLREDLDQVAQEVEEALENANTALDEAGIARGEATEALTAANGKNKVWYTNSQPPGTDHQDGDTWFNGSEGNRIYQWHDSAWIPVDLGEDAIADLAVTNAKIADGTIQNAKIANLDAGKINTGLLNAARIASGSINADKLASNAVTADKIAANAVTAAKISGGDFTGKTFTGGTFTGSLIRTAASGQRIQFDVNGLRAFNTSGVETSRISSSDGGFKVGTDSLTYTLLRSGYLDVRGGTSSRSSKVNMQSYGEGYYAGIAIEANWTGGFASLDLDVAGTGASRVSTLGTRGATPLQIGQADARTRMIGDWYHEDDTEWANVSIPGGTGVCQWRRKAGIVYVRFDITYSSAVGPGGTKDPALTLPVIPSVNTPMTIMGQGSFPVTGFIQESTGRVVFRNNHSGAISRFQGFGMWLEQ